MAFQGLPSTLCKGCGHNSITSYLIEACKSIGVDPYRTIKLSGIGCSSKTPAYFLQASHGFNALHGRMPSVATGAMVANSKLLCIGISGDGDTANIGMGQFKHICRRNVPIVYIVENNGCYGLTKGQFSATADLNQHLRRPTGEANDVPPSTLRRGHRRGGPPSWRGRSRATRSRWCRCSKAALKHKGNVGPRHHQPVRHFQRLRRLDQELGLGQGARRAAPRGGLRRRVCPKSRSSRKPARATRVQLHDGSWITFKALHHQEHDVTARCRHSSSWRRATQKNEFLTGLIYVDPKRRDFVTSQTMTDTPLALLPDEALRPSKAVLKKIMETI